MTYLNSEQGEGNDVSNLLQPYVDGELSPDDAARVVEHLENSADARRYVREQQEVRTLLRALDPDRAPAQLRARILAELDHVDAERSAAEGNGGGGKLIRLRAAFRGAMIMMPAAAAAVGLFFVVQSGALLGPDGEAGLQGSSAALVDRAQRPARVETLTGGPASLAAGPALVETTDTGSTELDLDLDDIDFPTEFSAPPSLPDGVRLVSAARDSANDATGEALVVEYVDRRSGARYVDRQRPRDAARPPADAGAVAHERDGITYTLWRDAAGRPQVSFDDGRVQHVLRHRGGDRANVGGPVSATAGDFEELLELAGALDRR